MNADVIVIGEIATTEAASGLPDDPGFKKMLATVRVVKRLKGSLSSATLLLEYSVFDETDGDNQFFFNLPGLLVLVVSQKAPRRYIMFLKSAGEGSTRRYRAVTEPIDPIYSVIALDPSSLEWEDIVAVARAGDRAAASVLSALGELVQSRGKLPDEVVNRLVERIRAVGGIERQLRPMLQERGDSEL